MKTLPLLCFNLSIKAAAFRRTNFHLVLGTNMDGTSALCDRKKVHQVKDINANLLSYNYVDTHHLDAIMHIILHRYDTSYISQGILLRYDLIKTDLTKGSFWGLNLI